MDFDIISFIANILKDIECPIQEGWYDEDINDTHITYFEYLDKPLTYLENEESSIEHNIQFDIWTKDSVKGNELKNKVKKLLKENDFIYEDGHDQFEPETKIFHKAFKVSYVEEF